MIVNFKYFYEKTDTNYEEYNKLWDKNKERIIFLHTNYPLSKQVSSIINDITINKDILAVRFPPDNFIKNNTVINSIMLGKGFVYDTNKIWYPKEVWIYNPIP
jgi:hypothetical protein